MPCDNLDNSSQSSLPVSPADADGESVERMNSGHLDDVINCVKKISKHVQKDDDVEEDFDDDRCVKGNQPDQEVQWLLAR